MPNCLKFIAAQKVLAIYFSYLFGLVGFLPISENVMSVPIMSKRYTQVKFSEGPYLKALS